MREYRDKCIAHLDSEPVMNIPKLDLARASVEFYHTYVVANEAQPGDLSGWPDTAARLQRGYKESEEEAGAVYKQIFPPA
jgi:hypothetical protein